MAELRLSGLSTGIDTGKLIEQLMEVNRRRLYMMQNDVQKHQEKRSAVSEFQSKLTSLKSSSDALSDSSQLRSYKAVTSDEDFITADANSNAIEGNHSVQVKQLATSDRWVHDGFKYPTSLVGTGTLILSYDYQEFSVTTGANTTLEGLVGLINNDSENPGINASILKYDDGNDGVYHLVLSGQESGTDYQVNINSSSTEVHTSNAALEDSNNENISETTKLTELSTYAGTMGDGSTSDRIHVTGLQHDGVTAVDYYFDVNEYTTFADVLAEIEEAYSDTVKATLDNGNLVLTDTTSGASGMTLTAITFEQGIGGSASLSLWANVTQTTAGGVAADLAGFEESTFNQVQSAQDSKIRVDGYPGDSMQIQEVQLLTSSANATGGTYDLTFGGVSTTLNFDDDITTVQTALNNLAGIQALGNVTVGGTPPNDSGSAMTITFAATAGDVEQITITSSLTGGNHTMSTQTTGKDGWISRSTNTVDDVIAGVTLKLHDTTEDGGGGYNSIEVNLTRDTEGLKEKVKGLVEAYNATVMFIQENTKYDAEEKKSGVLANEYFVNTVWSEMKDPLIGLVTGFDSDDPFIMPSDIGLTFDTDGLLEFDESEFDEAIIDDYNGVLALMGATKSGKSDRTDIKFYDAGTSTTAGEYEVEVFGDGSSITSARIRLVGDATWRNATIDGNIVMGDTSIDSTTGEPVYPEYNLHVTVDVSKTLPGGVTAIINVKQGFAGAVEDVLKDILDSEHGRVPISLDSIDTKIENVDKRIEQEEARLVTVEKRLIEKFARLERTLSMIQQQMGALNMI